MFRLQHVAQAMRWLVVVLFTLSVFTSAASAEDPLPSSVSSSIKRINSMLDQAVKGLEADRMTTAERKLADAKKELETLKKRYSGKFPEDHSEYVAMLNRLDEVAKLVESGAGAAAEVAQQQAEAKAKNDALCQEWADKLAPFTKHGDEKYLRIGRELNGATPEEQAQSRAAFQEAKALMAEYDKVQFPLGKTMTLQNAESSLRSSMGYYQQDEDKDAQEQACAEWVAKLRPYADLGMHSDKLLIASVTVNAEDLKQRQAIYAEAKTLFEAYQQAEFPLGKTYQLQQLETYLSRELEEFPKTLAESQAMMSGDIEKSLDATLAFMTRDTSWEQDKLKKPPVVMERDLKPMRQRVEEAASASSESDPKVVAIRSKLKQIVELNEKHAKVRADRTFQRADGFGGSELKSLKNKANEVVEAGYKGVSVLRTTVPSKAWGIEDVIEATDTTNTALRHRITRSVRAQVAIKLSDGTVYLQEVYIGQDKQPDGGWGEMKGHTTWRDPMNASNVGTDAPA